MSKRAVSKEEYGEVIDEITEMRKAIAKAFDVYTMNAIDRLIYVRIKLEHITIAKEPTQKEIQKMSDDAMKRPASLVTGEMQK